MRKKGSDDAANDEAMANSVSKSESGYYGAASWWPDGMGVVTALSGGGLSTLAYSSDPVNYINSILPVYGKEILDTALSKIPDYTLDLVTLAGNVGLSLTGVQYASLSGVPYLETQSVSLGNHHIYGSSRLGIAQYQPLQFRYNWDYKYGLVDTFGLTKQRSWYSYLQNAPMNAGTTSAYGNQLDSVAEADHIIGQKQYELVNHLGNVQETVSDKKFSKDLNGDSTRDEYRAASVMVYDYYPFGMLMPGRSLDTAGLCVTRTTYQEVPHYNWVNGNALDGSGGGSGASAIGAASMSAGSGTGVDVSGTGDGISFTISGITTVTVWQGTNTSSSGTQLGSKATGVVSPTIGIPVSAGGTSTSPATVTVVITMPTGSSRSLFNLDSIGYQTLTYTLATGTYTQCGDPIDKYEFGFNGQMKSNEVAGVGNHNSALFWEYDTRLGRRWNLDPKPNAWESKYAVSGDNPIRYSDALGDKKGINLNKTQDSHETFFAAANALSDGKDDGVFIVFAHGNSSEIEYEKNGEPFGAKTAKEFNDAMCAESKEWTAAMNSGKEIVLILASCNTASNEFYEGGFAEAKNMMIKKDVTIAQQISKTYKNLTVVSPDGYACISSSGMVGIQQWKTAGTPNTGKGGFVIYKEGKAIGKVQDAIGGDHVTEVKKDTKKDEKKDEKKPETPAPNSCGSTCDTKKS